MRTSKYHSYLQKLSKKPVFVAKEARALGIPSRMLAYFCKVGVIDRLSRGVYKSKEIAIKVLQNYLHPTKQIKPDLKKLLAYAKALRVGIEPYILSLTT